MGRQAAAVKKAAAKKTAKKDDKDKKGDAGPTDKKDVSNMLGTLKCSKDPEKKEVLEYYKSLPSFDNQKNELLKMWKADKSCKWRFFWDVSVALFFLRFKIAELLHLPVESQEPKTILAALPQDDEGYSKAGLARYHLEGLKPLTTSGHKDTYQEEISHTKNRQVTREEGQLQLQNVKPENPSHDTLQGKIQVAGKQALEKVHSQSQD